MLKMNPLARNTDVSWFSFEYMLADAYIRCIFDDNCSRK